jgi:hypothetical protein
MPRHARGCVSRALGTRQRASYVPRAAELEAAGHTAKGNKQFSATAISRMIAA